ncbi:hypothetical protein [Kitasatospora sp. NPDC059803]|uniref:hypothetical protein n=1 Tax=Kitasatospora sp. NPDC059803 TaxID=3346953 RepID=UPI003656515A
MAMFGRFTNEHGKRGADELALLRTEFGQELRAGLAEIRRLQADLRQQLGASLDTGMQDLRDDLRELRRELNDAHKSITEARRESESLRLELETARREAAEVRAEVDDEPAERSGEPAVAVGLETVATPAASVLASCEEALGSSALAPESRALSSVEHEALDAVLEKAAGVSAADLICHRDAWAFIVEQAARNAHFRVPGLAADGDDEQTVVTLSGRTLIAILSALYTTQHLDTTSREDRALASTYYRRITSVINNALPLQSAATRTRIVVDDRPPSTIDSASC